MEKALTALANIALLVVCGIAGVIFYRNFTASAHHKAQLNAPLALVGRAFPEDARFHSGSKYVVVVMSVGCHFCTESAPFYRDLQHTASEDRVQIYAALPDDLADSRRYLDGIQVPIPVSQIDLRELRVVGTPTLFVVDRSGVVKRVWVGKLSADQQKEVVESIR